MKQSHSLTPLFLETFPDYVEHFEAFLQDAWNPYKNSDIPNWKAALSEMPKRVPSSIDLNRADIRVGVGSDLTDEERDLLKENLKALHPWRKGPFNLFGIPIDTEWRSDWKWDRLAGQISALKDQVVLDIGCGSGYHCWRMLGEGAKYVLGLEPALVYVFQFQVFQKYIGAPAIEVLPLGIQHLPCSMPVFDTVFSMGLLYHRKEPLEHLRQLRALLRAEGELVLETLIVEGKAGDVLVPEGRYAQMRNVWNLPSVQTTEGWLREVGFEDVRCVDVTKTTFEEQRTTDWMTFQSLCDFLNPEDSSLTVEGYPAPKRAIFLARQPSN